MIHVLILFLLLAPSVVAEEFTVRLGHTRWVLALAVSPDGKLLASGGDDQTVQLWDLIDGAEPRLLREFGSAVTALEFGKDGKSLAVGTWDGALVWCDVGTGKIGRRLREHRETITTLRLDPSGDYLASGSADDRLIVWDAASDEDLLTFHQGNEYDVTTAAFSPDGKRIATGDGENQIKLWDAETGDEVETLIGHDEPVTCVAYDAAGQLVSGSWDDTLRVWRESDPLVLKGHEGDITALAVDVERKRVLSVSEDKTLRVWDGGSGTLLRTLSGHREAIRCLATTPDGRTAFTGSRERILQWDLGGD